MSAWEDRLAGDTQPLSANWENRAPAFDYSPTPSPLSDSWLENTLAGAGKAMTDVYRGIAQKSAWLRGDKASSDSIAADIAESRRLDASLMNSKAGRYGNVGGVVAAGLPLMMVPGVNTLAGAGLVGATTGALLPSLSPGEMAQNTAAGGAGGVAGNVVGRVIGAGANLVRSAVQPFFKGGQETIAGDTLRRFVSDPQAVAGRLSGAGELVPGSAPTAAQVGGDAGLAQLEQQVQQLDPQIANLFSQRTQAQQAARTAAVNSVGGDDAKRAFFAANRDATADQLYSAARAVGVDTSKVTPALRQTMDELTQNPYIQEAVPTAKRLARADGVDLNGGSLDAMHYLKLALDDGIQRGSNPTTALGSKTLAQMAQAKDKLLSVMDTVSPDYGAARKTFAAMSQPINQMDVGRALADKLSPAISDFGATGGQNANAYALALRNGDALAQKVTGNGSATLDKVLTPDQLGTLNSVGQDLARSVSARNLAATPGSPTARNLVSQNIISNTIGPLGLPASAAQNTLLASILRPAQYVGSLGEHGVLDTIAHSLLEPSKAADLLLRTAQPGLLERGAAAATRLGSAMGSTVPALGLLAPNATYAQYLSAYDKAPDAATRRQLGAEYEAQKKGP